MCLLPPQVPDVDTTLPEASGDLSVPSVDVDAPSTSVEAPSVDLSGKLPDMPSGEGDISGDLPSGDSSVEVEGGDSSLTSSLVTGGAALLGGLGAAIGLSGGKAEGEVRWNSLSCSL